MVNMTFKYFYVFRKEIDIDIDFSRCDCPLDSIIQNKLKEDFTWSKLDKEKYDEIQSKIDNKVRREKEYGVLGRLLYDFTEW